MQIHAFLVAAVMAVGCASEPDTGEVGLALTATGGDGSVYRLPANTQLLIQSNRFFEQLPLDADASSLTVALPVGMHSAQLVHPQGHTTMWPLVRTKLSGEQDIAWATLVTPMPATFSIMPNVSTPLAIAFRVFDSGTVVFAQGSLVVSTDVAIDPASGATMEMAAYPVTLTGATTADAPAGLAATMPADAAVVDLVVLVDVIGPWAQASTTMACSPVSFTAVGSGHTGIQHLLFEASEAANSEVCVFTSGGKHYVQLLAVDAKIPQTASFAPFGGTMEFLVGVSGEFPVPLFTSGTLELHELDGVHTLPLGGLLRIRGLVNSSWAIWYRASLSGTVVLNFQPTE